MSKRNAVRKGRITRCTETKLEVRSLAARTGPRFRGPRFSEWLPLDSIGLGPGSRATYVDLMLQGKVRVPPELTSHPRQGYWQLAPDWQFGEIVSRAESDPTRRWFPGKVVPSAPVILTEQLHALEQALYDRHPGITREALDDFWFSADVGDFVRGLERRLRDDPNSTASSRIEWEKVEEEGREDFGPFVGDRVNCTKLFVWHQLTEYFAHIEGHEEPEGIRLISKGVWTKIRMRFRDARRSHGHGQADAGTCLSRDQSTIGRWERGQAIPPRNMQAAIEHYIATGTGLPER